MVNHRPLYNYHHQYSNSCLPWTMWRATRQALPRLHIVSQRSQGAVSLSGSARDPAERFTDETGKRGFNKKMIQDFFRIFFRKQCNKIFLENFSVPVKHWITENHWFWSQPLFWSESQQTGDSRMSSFPAMRFRLCGILTTSRPRVFPANPRILGFEPGAVKQHPLMSTKLKYMELR